MAFKRSAVRSRTAPLLIKPFCRQMRGFFVVLNRLLKKKYEESYEITVIIAGTNSKSPIDISLLLDQNSELFSILF